MTTLTTAATIDELLGEASSRFFGSIYRTAEQHSQVKFTPKENDSWSVEGTATVHYPTTWGQRQGAERTPHLSTVDAILFLAQIGSSFNDEAIRSGFCVEGETISMTHVLLRAGSAPNEALNGVPVSGMLVARDGGLHAEVRIGNMRTTADYHVGANTTENGVSCKAMTACATPTITLTDVVVDADASEARATIVTPDRKPGVPGEALLVANIVACSQVAQALIAALDGIPREESNTLWMRKYEGWTSASSTGYGTAAHVAIDEHRLLPVAGKKFSIFNGHAKGCDVDSQFSIAHALPDRPSIERTSGS